MKVDPFPYSHIIPENSSMSANKKKSQTHGRKGM